MSHCHTVGKDILAYSAATSGAMEWGDSCVINNSIHGKYHRPATIVRRQAQHVHLSRSYNKHMTKARRAQHSLADTAGEIWRKYLNIMLHSPPLEGTARAAGSAAGGPGGGGGGVTILIEEDESCFERQSPVRQQPTCEAHHHAAAAEATCGIPRCVMQHVRSPMPS